MKEKPLTIYPDPNVRRAVSRISEEDHDRPLSKVVELAVKAFAVLWDRDRSEARKLADQFDSESAK